MSATSAETEQSRVPSRKRVTAALVAGAVLVIDQLSKWWVLDSIGTSSERSLFGSVRLIVRFNRGMAFSVGHARSGTAWIVSLAILGLVVWVWLSLRQATTVRAVLLGFVLGGALGNQVDRWFRNGGWNRGAVVDFIDVGFWPVFNVADAALSCGCVALVLWSMFFDRTSGAAVVKNSSTGLLSSRDGDEQNGTSSHA